MCKVIWSRDAKPAPVEHAAGNRYCPDCQRIVPLAEYHYRTYKGRKRPQPYCIRCMRLRWHKWNNKARQSQAGTTAEPYTPVAYTPSDPLACMGTVGGFLRGSL